MKPAWAFTSGVFDMALFCWWDQLDDVPGRIREHRTMLVLIGFMLTVSLAGLVTAAYSSLRHHRKAVTP